MPTTTPLLCGVGDNVVDRYPDLGLEFPGGNACNVAVYARRSGAEASYIGVVGDDEAAGCVLDGLRAEGVDVSRVRRHEGANSYATVRLDPDGNREFLEWAPMRQRLVLEPADLAHLGSCDLVHTGHASFTEPMVPQMAEVAAVSFDFSYKGLDYAAPLLPYLSVATFSGATLSRDDAVDLAATAQAAGPQLVLVTRGADGAVVRHRGVVHHQSAEPVTVTDTLGAGDAFLARLLTGLLRGELLELASAAAAALAAEVCGSFGAFGRGRSTERERSGS